MAKKIEESRNEVLDGAQGLIDRGCRDMNWLKLRYEVLLISIARIILKGRNVARSKHVSRSDNNAMWYMAEQLENIEKNMLSKYEKV